MKNFTKNRKNSIFVKFLQKLNTVYDFGLKGQISKAYGLYSPNSASSKRSVRIKDPEFDQYSTKSSKSVQGTVIVRIFGQRPNFAAQIQNLSRFPHMKGRFYYFSNLRRFVSFCAERRSMSALGPNISKSPMATIQTFGLKFIRDRPKAELSGSKNLKFVRDRP